MWLRTSYFSNKRSLAGLDIIVVTKRVSVESSSHVFFSCTFARKIWRKVLIWWELDDIAIHSYNEWLLWLANVRLPKRSKGLLEGSCYVLWWIIWRHRNSLIFNHPPRNQENFFDDVVHMSYLWLSSRFKPKINWISWLKNPNCITL
ncbi:reverse transcriptase domain, Reverse transcriptase zinc-binding domain protein [Artemisia annua]|uniref:Reverse transcriptase domain, Reverse transcriptase zinc-binding domain protein n=1 Tax=Artemisia annua TaxID=35608 RepID=A0A2U1L8V6_ARTAN|nr:reverse transcriptase domain, Reverse transcriptase zinc-binding domain protein [Artemisia annua]